MLSNEVKVIKADQMGQIDTSKSFILWSHLGVGSCTLLMEQFGSDEYHVHRIISPAFSEYDMLSLPMLDGSVAEPKWVAELASVRESGKKLVLMFDEISNPSKASSDTFKRAVVNRMFGKMTLHPDDVVLGIGRIDTDGHIVDTLIHDKVLTTVEHYAITR